MIKEFNRKSKVYFIWENRHNNWKPYRSIEEIINDYGEIDVYTAKPKLLSRVKREAVKIEQPKEPNIKGLKNLK